MGTIDNNGIFVYDETDMPSPLHTFMNQGQASVSAAVEGVYQHTLIMPVANSAARDAYEQNMRDSGRPPTPNTPLYVDRADTGALERNRGAGWERMVNNTLETHVPVNTDPLWEFNNKIFLKNGHVTAKVRTKRLGGPWSGSSAAFWGALPQRFRPPDSMFDMVYVHVRNDVYRTGMFHIHPDGSGNLRSATVGQGNWINATISWPTES